MSTNSNTDDQTNTGTTQTGPDSDGQSGSVAQLFAELEKRTAEERESTGDDPNLYTSEFPASSSGTQAQVQAQSAKLRPQATGQAAAEKPDASELFRHEAAISQMDLRLEVAHRVERYIKEDERIALDEKLVYAWGDLSFVCGSRSRTIEGNYTRTTGGTEIFMMSHDTFNEEVHGGVSVDMSVESEIIMGGGYLGTVIGPYMRICGWTDFLAWGGWAEADVVRAEVGTLMVHSMMNFVHTAGVRALAAYTFFDDFTQRNENFGTLVDNTLTVTHAGTPGSGVANDT